MTQPIEPAVTACAELEADLVLLHFGDVDGGERARLQNHAANCTGCSTYLRELTTLIPATLKTDMPPQEFWTAYSRELRHKIDTAVESKPWWQSVAAMFQPRYLPAFAAAAIVALTLTFTLGRGLWPGNEGANDGAFDKEFTETLPVAENLEFFRAMDVLDNLDVLELMGSQNNNAA